MASRELRRLKEKKQEKKQQQPKLVRSTFSLIIIGIIIIAFLFAYIGSTSIQSQGVVFGSYAGRDIMWLSGNYFARRLYYKIEELKRLASQNEYYREYINNLSQEDIVRMVYDEMITHTAIVIEAEKSGLGVSEQKVDEAIVDSGLYSKGGNEFDTATYKAEEDTIRDFFKQNLIESQFRMDYYTQIINNKEIEFMKQLGAEERKFRFIQFEYNDYPLQEILNYGLENADQFRRIKLSRIIIKTSKEDAEEVRNKIINNIASFEEMAAEYAQNDDWAQEGGKLDWQKYYEIRDSFGEGGDIQADIIFSLKQGEISAVMALAENWVIFRCDQEAEDPDFSDAATLDDLKNFILWQQKGTVQDYFEAKAQEFKKGAQESGFIQVCRAQNLDFYTTDFFPLNMGPLNFLKAIPPLEKEAVFLHSAAVSEDFFLKAFSLNIDQISEPVLLEDRVIILQLIDIREASSEELESIRTKFAQFKSAAMQNDFSTLFVKEEKKSDRWEEAILEYMRILEQYNRGQ